jgi:8-oxo-dGTP diphosphatase
VNAPKSSVEVALALVWRVDRLLVARRPAGVHLAGFWEFPGGKLRAGETPEACAVRELGEELGVVARARCRRPRIEWEYPERRVTLHPIDCDWVAGEGTAREVIDFRWIAVEELASLELPPANAGLVAELLAERRR